MVVHLALPQAEEAFLFAGLLSDADFGRSFKQGFASEEAVAVFQDQLIVGVEDAQAEGFRVDGALELRPFDVVLLFVFFS